MKVEIDISDVELAEAEARAEMKTLPRRMLAAVKAGAFYELTEKTYVDRTRNARQSTRGYIDRSGAGEVVAVLEAGAEYASYLAARGFSAIHEAGRFAEATIDDQIDDLGEKVTGR